MVKICISLVDPGKLFTSPNLGYLVDTAIMEVLQLPGLNINQLEL